MKTPEQIKSELDKLTAIELGSLKPADRVGCPYAVQALSWVLKDISLPVSELIPQVNNSGGQA